MHFQFVVCSAIPAESEPDLFQQWAQLTTTSPTCSAWHTVCARWYQPCFGFERTSRQNLSAQAWPMFVCASFLVNLIHLSGEAELPNKGIKCDVRAYWSYWVLLKSTKTKYKRMRGKLHCRGVFCNSPTVCRECTISLWILPRQFELHDKPWLKLSHFALMPDHVTALCTCHRRVWNTTQARYTARNTRSLRGWQCKWPTSKQCTIVGCVKLFVRPMTHFRCLLWVQRCMLPYCTLDRWEGDQMVGFCGSDVLFSSHVSLAKCVCVSKYLRSKNRAVQLVHRHSRKLWYHYSTRLLDASDVFSWKNPLWRHHDIFTPIVQYHSKCRYS